MQQLFLLIGTALGGSGIAIGAFGAHALKNILVNSGRLDVYETAVKYQFYHAFALLILGLLMYRMQSPLLNYAGIAFILGTIIFSGSLYILCLSGVGKWGAVTPFGGIILIIGWSLLFAGIAQSVK